VNVVISSAGSVGDVLPHVAVGWELKRRGHTVTLVANASFERWAREAGIGFAPAGTVDDHLKFLGDADFWEPGRKDLEQARAEHYYPHVFDFYRRVLESATPPRTVVISGEAGGMIAAEKLGVPLAHIACAPAISIFTQSQYDPSHPERLLPSWARWFAGDSRRLAILSKLNDFRRGRKRTTGQPVHLPVEHPLARLRAEAGLTPMFAPRPNLTLCMWPEWFAAPQPDWPEGAMVTGFPFYPRPKTPPRAPAGAAASDEAAPIVVTTGSVAGSQFAFYEMAVEACSTVGRPVVLVSPHRNHIPAALPSNVTWVAHAPFDELFGRAALVVHHGGIGTASYGIATGIPQIVMPMRGDQFDNGNRLERLGVGRMLSAKRTSAAKLRATVTFMLESQDVASQCRHWQSRVDVEAGLRMAVDAIEERF
jgi:rhamnosyltransferase subunit B